MANNTFNHYGIQPSDLPLSPEDQATIEGPIVFKFLRKNGHHLFAPNNPDSGWSMPVKNPDTGLYTPGEWAPRIKRMRMCLSGYHFPVNTHDFTTWLGPRLYAMEIVAKETTPPDYAYGTQDNKAVTRQARLLCPIETYSVEKIEALIATYLIGLYDDILNLKLDPATPSLAEALKFNEETVTLAQDLRAFVDQIQQQLNNNERLYAPYEAGQFTHFYVRIASHYRNAADLLSSFQWESHPVRNYLLALSRFQSVLYLDPDADALARLTEISSIDHLLTNIQNHTDFEWPFESTLRVAILKSAFPGKSDNWYKYMQVITPNRK